jgi:hypothetical protein
MAIYVVMEPPAVDVADPAERAILVRDGFAFLAFLVPPLWLLWHRLWIEAALALAVSVGLTVLGETAGLGFLGAALSLLVSIYVGLEGPALRINALRRRGWHDRGVVEAANAGEAEIRYLAGEEADDTVEEAPLPVALAPAAVSRPSPAGPALGLLGYPGRQ